MQNSTERAKLRKSLLDNGYRPLPLLDKGIRIKGWSTADITEEWLAQFARSASYKNTGIRCDDLAAFDIDVLDEDLANEIEDFILDKIGWTELCRIGQWPKRLLLYRVSGDALHSMRTGKYQNHMVELLCGSGRQFAAFGMHPSGKEYEWLSEALLPASPLTTPYKDLPVVSFEHAVKIMQEIEQLFIDKGMRRDAPGGKLLGGGTAVHDLDGDFEFQYKSGEVVRWADLRDDLTTAGVWGNVRREDGEFGDSDAVHAFISAGVNEPCLHDFARDLTHYEVPATTALGELLPDTMPVDMFTCRNLRFFLENFVLLGDKTVRHIDQPERAYPLDGFATLYLHKETPTPTKANKNKTTPTVTLWKKHADTVRAHYCALRPDREEVIISQGDVQVFNTYNPPQHVSGGVLDEALELLEHLIPDPRERQLFIEWHALKLAHPEYRMHGLVTVTKKHGTGRGTWAKILEKLIGAAYFRSVEMKEVFGSSGQADFNEFIASSLVVYVPEALEEDRAHMTHWESRMAAYEKVKSICEPDAQKMYIKRKYGRNTHENVYASILISSNHTDAFAVDPDDRRLIVLMNTDKALIDAGDLAYRVYEWMKDDRNIGALYEWLIAQAADASYDPFGWPPMTSAKQAMIEAGQSGLDQIWEEYLEWAEGDLSTVVQWKHFAYERIRTREYNVPEKQDALERGLNGMHAKYTEKLENIPASGLKVKGAKVRPRILRNMKTWRGCKDNDLMRKELLKNGHAGGQIIDLK